MGMKEQPAAIRPQRNGCSYCGYLDWTVEKYGRVTHKQGCPMRTDPWHQGDPYRQPIYWLIRLHDGMISHHPYKTETTRDKWAAKYRARGDRVETEGVMIHG